MRRAGRGVAANNIVVEHSAHRVSLLLHPFEHPGAAQQSLLFARDRRKQQRRAKRIAPHRCWPAQQAGAFHTHRNAGSIIVRARRVQIWIHYVAGSAVKMSGDDEYGF